MLECKLYLNLDYLSDNVDSEVTPEIYERTVELVNEELKKFFRPEFLNRIDEIIIFSHLTKQDVRKIADIMIKQLGDRLREKEITLEVTPKAKQVIIEEGFDPIYGARPLRRAVMRLLEDNLAKEFLSKTLYPNTRIVVDSDYDEEIIVNVDYSYVDPTLRKEEEKSEAENIEFNIY